MQKRNVGPACWLLPLLFLTVLSACSGVAENSKLAAQQCTHWQIDELFDPVDSNHDGKISLVEMKAAGEPTENFDSIDANHDGFIIKAEYGAVTPPPGMDVNNDCVLTLAERDGMRAKGPPPGGPSQVK